MGTCRSMRTVGIGLGILYALTAGAAPDLEKSPGILGVGEQRLWRIPAGLRRFSGGGPAVRAISVGQTALLIKGVQPGIAELRVWKPDGSTENRTFQVEKTPSLGLPAPLLRALGKLEECEVWAWEAGGIILRGEIQSLAEAARIRALAALYPREIRNETEPSEALVTEGQARLAQWAEAHAAWVAQASLTTERLGRDLFVRGHATDPGRLGALRRALEARYPLARLELDCLPDADPTVHFQVFLLEVKKHRLHSLGLGWPGGQEGAFRVTPSAVENALQLEVSLQALEAEGAVRVLSNPELVVRAPGEAELFAGGELPITSRSHVSAQVSWKNFGLTLRLKVTHSAGPRVRLEIWTEVSHLDAAMSAEPGPPGIRSNRMRTQVDARYGVPLLLSGLLQETWHKQARGLPGLRDLPVLGALFGSEDFLEDRSELVAVLLPRAAPPPQPMARLTRLLPRGPIPFARRWISPEEERTLRAAADWPWNALE